MTFVGDVMMSDKVEGILQKNGYDFPYTFVKSYFQQADISVANLETPVTEDGIKQDKQYSYRSSPLALPPMAQAGIDLVNLANNHSMDRGADGLMDTIRHLDENGILHTGAGANIDEAYKPAVIEKNGMKVAFFGFSHIVPDVSWKAAKNQIGTTQIYDPTQAIDAIKKTRPDVDLVVVIAHWGTERQDQIENYQRTLAEKFIDAGADLIVGGHPHVLQGFEQYKGKWIAYSLGNFIFTTNSVAKTWDSMILQASCKKGGGCDLNVVPVLTTYAKPEPMKEPKAGQLLNRLTQISYGAKVDSNGHVTTVKP
jgi:poly-gamma-glutamate synthesis protein (capsule biosynthesis protein)